jgi:hypothetical protein
MSKEEHQNQVNNYQTNVETAKIEHQERLKDYEAEVKSFRKNSSLNLPSTINYLLSKKLPL